MVKLQEVHEANGESNRVIRSNTQATSSQVAPIPGETAQVPQIQNSMSVVSPSNSNVIVPEQAIRMSDFNISSDRAIRIRAEDNSGETIDITDEIYNTKMQLSLRILATAVFGLGFLARSFQQAEAMTELMSKFTLAYCFISANLVLYLSELIFKLYYKKMLEPHNY